jgi:putative hydrolase of the HAD superfamily
MIKAIGFDLWETLITDTPDVSRQQERLRLTRMEQILSAHGFGAEAERIERAYRQLWHRCHERYWSADLDVPCRRQIEHFLEELEIDPYTFSTAALDELEHAYADAAVQILPRLVDGAHEVLAALEARGFALGLISNTGRTPGYALREILRRLGVASLLDVMVFSNEHGVCKPQTSIFEELRRGLGVGFHEILFVGDNLHVDILGAQRCGMRAVHFVPAVRGTAVAPPVETTEAVIADATITDLRDILGAVGEYAA